ncbi:MAG: hypothetical protein PHF86_12555 [Candidatus Nanoarchaeia archaeon]|nr:hypothetical protein [Candidatus Nanoarchaeia archaeon]
MFNFNNQRGSAAIVYTLCLVCVVGITGAVMLKTVGYDRTNVANAGKTRSAYQAASTAVKACETQLEKKSVESITVMNNYLTEKSKKWLLSADPSSEQKISMSTNVTDPAKFSVCILGIGEALGDGGYNIPHIIVQGNGYGQFSGKKKTAVATYQLDGTEFDRPSVQDFAIYIQKDGYDFNQKMTVNGNVYFGGGVRFNSNASGSIINGYLKTGDNGTTTEFNGQLTVNGNAYFQTPVKLQNSSLDVNGKAGFKRNIELLNTLNINGEGYFTNSISGTFKVDMKNHKAYHSGSCMASQFQNLTALENKGSFNISDYVDISGGNENATTINMTTISSDKIKEFSTLGFTKLNGTNLQNAYDNTPADQLWNGYLVVAISNSVPTFYTADVQGIFSGKVIFIVSKELSINSNWYESSSSSTTLLYVKDGGKLWQIGWPGLFKGYIHIAGSGGATYAFRAGSSLQGAIHQINNSEFQANTSNLVTITYDGVLMGELASLKIITNTKYPATAQTKIVLVDTKIRPKLISLSL